ncbi:MAG: histidine phosphatase family protein, partial [Spirochaetaceae bacterium]
MQQSIWIVRHATRIDVVDPSWKEKAERPFDPYLAEQGLGEAESLGAFFERESFERVYCSPFIRAVQTAAPIAKAAGCALRIEPGLAEWLNRDWFDGVPALAPQLDPDGFEGEIDLSFVSPVVLTYPETWDAVMYRTLETVTRLAENRENVVLVGHGASVLGCVAALLGASTPEAPPPPIASVYKFTRNGGPWEPELLADTSHLSAKADRAG